MRLVFLGSAAFALPSLRACAAHHDLVAVVTQPDRPGSRGRSAPRPVAEAARSLGLDVWQPSRLRDPVTEERLLSLAADALVVAAYGRIISETLLRGPRYGGVNVHASLLPRWRGAAPVAAAILAGDAETGVSIMHMDSGLDTGPVYLQRRVPISAQETTPSLTATLAEIGAELLGDVLQRLTAGAISATPQDDALASYAPRLRRDDARTEWGRFTAVEIDRRVRALQPWPGVLVELAGAEVQLLAGAPVGEVAGVLPGQLAGTDGDSVVVATSAGGYRIDAVRPAGRTAMSPGAFLRGRRTASAAR
jgi:methionyl-tRNA formyltransferase